MKILNIGSCNIDYVYGLNHIVTDGETEQSERLDIFPGGKGLNQSVAAARAGAKVYHAAIVGSDGDFLLKTLKENGVDISLTEKVKDKNGHAVIQVNSEGENAIIVYPGTNHGITKEYIDKILLNFSAGDLLVLQNEVNELEYIVHKAYKQKLKVILNPSPICENLYNIKLSEIAYLIMNENEAKKLLKGNSIADCLQKAKKELPDTAIVITLGKKGAVYIDNKKQVYQNAFAVKTVDTTAAGDTFTGYFVAGLFCRKPIKEILKQASAAAAIAVSKSGASSSIPAMEEVLSLMPQMEECKNNYDIKSAEQLKVITDFINENLKQASLKQLAQKLNYSYNSAGVLVKRITGKSFTEYLQTKRLEKALFLLKETSLPVLEISNSVGYENNSFFCRKFKEKYNITPKQYRLRHKA